LGDRRREIDEYGNIGLLIIAATGALWATFKVVIPEFFRWWTAYRVDQEEHRQLLEQSDHKLTGMERLSEINRLAYLEDQLTMIASESQSQLDRSNEFGRSVVQAELTELRSILTDVNSKLSLLIRIVEEVYDRSAVKE